MEEDLILPSSSDPHLLEISRVQCLSEEEFGVFKSTTVTGGFSIFIITASSDEVRWVLGHVEKCSPFCRLKLLQGL